MGNVPSHRDVSQRMAAQTKLRLLECKLDPAKKGLTGGGLAGGRGDPKRHVTASRKLDGVCYRWCHAVICIAIAKLWLEACEESFFATIPGDVNFHAGDLPAI